MNMKLCVALALSCGATLCAQNQPAAPQVLKPQVYIRRFSVGATLSVLGLSLVPNRGLSSVTTSPAVDALYTTEALTRRVGFGLTIQGAVTQHFAVNASLLRRRVGYKMNSDIYTGTDNPITSADERTNTVRNEDTRAKLSDVPVVVRYYHPGRFQRGPHWFVEGGGVLRRVFGIKTSIDTTVGSKATDCCDVTPATPAQRTVRGFVAGAGVQLIDPVGIRVVPEVRYTRWLSATFSSFSTFTRRDQVEGMISLTF
jgi:hypothetical protein